ncbi:hypothetical protein [Pseudomonas purpurea]|uniref:Imm32 family immunity protein n=1 Tax=Pseudomonas purpurea TaxID=3136737 RepID=UPI0032638128
MEALKGFVVHGAAVGDDKSIRLDEVSILADPETIRVLGEFLINASREMVESGIEHVHLQDVYQDFSSSQHVDIIALNQVAIQVINKA